MICIIFGEIAVKPEPKVIDCHSIHEIYAEFLQITYNTLNFMDYKQNIKSEEILCENVKQLILHKFKVLNDLKEDFKQNIKILYVFKDYWNKENVFLVTNDDKVYCFGSNSYGLLGFGHDNEVNELTLNQELSHKQIIDFKNSYYHVIARTSDEKVYCWGYNDRGCLGNGKNDYKIYKPELNQYLSEKQIIDICCGVCHTIVLTISGEVYSWGCNDWGQIGIGSDDECVSVPTLLNAFNGEKVKAISCGFNHSLALTESGRVFSWGSNEYKQLGVSYNSLKKSNKPILIEMNEIIIEKISCGRNHNLLLSREGDIYVFGDNSDGQLGTGDREKIVYPQKLNHSEKFTDISSHSHENISIFVSDKNVFYIWGNEVITEPKETKFKSFDEIFEYYLKINYKPIQNRIISFDYHFVINGKYQKEFNTEKQVLGEGSYGKVFKVKKLNTNEDKFFALKEIKFKESMKKNF